MKGGFNALGGARAQAMLLLVLAFLAGAVAGGAAERVAIRRQWDRLRPAGARMMGPGYFRGGRSGPGGAGFFERLGLSGAQRTQIDAIVGKRRARIDSVMRQSGGVMRAAMDSTRTEIDAVLTPAQRVRADSLRAQRRAARTGRGGMPGAPPPDR